MRGWADQHELRSLKVTDAALEPNPTGYKGAEYGGDQPYQVAMDGNPLHAWMKWRYFDN